jgi:transposase
MESKGSTRKYRNESERRRLVIAYSKSGLSQEAFCKLEGLSQSVACIGARDFANDGPKPTKKSGG